MGMMDHKTIQIYMYMGSYKPIVKWLKEEGVTTQKEALNMLKYRIRDNVKEVDASIRNANNKSECGSYAGTAFTVKKILKEFPV